jgi:hypothetical protein
MPPNSLRLAYMAEFLLALVSIVELWSQAGGQGHLDLMPWYTKLLLVTGLALVTVAGTVAAVAHERAWNAKTIACLLIALMLAGGMAATTYYYHLHENDDSEKDDENSSKSLLIFPARPTSGMYLMNEARL